MAPLYYFAAYTDSGFLVSCTHEHATVISAVVCISAAGGYVVAVENEQLRELSKKEEREFQFAMYGTEIVRGRLRPLRPLNLTKPILN